MVIRLNTLETEKKPIKDLWSSHWEITEFHNVIITITNLETTKTHYGFEWSSNWEMTKFHNVINTRTTLGTDKNPLWILMVFILGNRGISVLVHTVIQFISQRAGKKPVSFVN